MSSVAISAQTHEFLNHEPGQLAVIGSNASDGHPLLAPVWYRWDGEAILVWSSTSRVWIKNVIRDPRVGVSIQGELVPGVTVIIRGRASVETSNASHIDDEILRITRRYVAANDIDAYLADWPELRTIVRIVPHKVFCWP